MLVDQRGDAIRVPGREAEPRAKLARDIGAGLRMIGRPSLGDVVQEGGEVEFGAVRDLVDELARKRVFVLQPPRLDRAQRADRPDQMLVDGVMVIHRKLHHPDDATEIRDEPAEHAGLVHPPKRGFRRVARGQDLQKQAVGLGVLAQSGVDALQRLGDEPRRVRVDRQVRAFRDPEEPDQVDRVALENIGAEDVDAVRFDLEVLGVRDGARPAAPQPSDEPVEHRRGLRLALLERGADDRRQVADVLGDQEIVLHEAFDVGLAGPGRIAELPGDRPLDVEAEALLGPSGEKMQPAAHRPKNFLAAAEQGEFARREHAGGDQVVGVAARDKRISRSRRGC